MTVTITEQLADWTYSVGGKYNSRTYEAVKIFHVSGVSGTSQAVDAVDSETGFKIPVISEHYTDEAGNPQVPVVSHVDAKVNGLDDLYTVTVTYSNSTGGNNGSTPNTPSEGDESWNFEPTSNEVNIQDSISQNGYPTTGTGAAPDVGNSVGVDADGNIEGLFIPDDGETLTVDYWMKTTDIDDTFLNDVRSVKNKICSAEYYGLAIGECRFDGMYIVEWGKELTQLRFNFSVSRNKTTAELPTYKDKQGTSFTIPNGKKGWEYIWKQSQVKNPNGTTGLQEVVTAGVWVSKIFEDDDFSKLPLSGDLTKMFQWLTA